MKEELFLLTVFALSFNLLQAQENESVKEEEVFHYSYSSKEITLLSITNKYGSINYSGTLKDSVIIDIAIKLENPDDEYAAEVFDMVKVKPVLSKKTITVKTGISGNFSSNDKFSVTYIIKGPPNLSLIFNNQFDDIELTNFNGNADITIEHGNFSATNSFSKLKLMLKNGKANLPKVSVINASLTNSYFFLENTDNIDLNAELSNIIIENGGLVNATGQSNTFNIGEVDDLSISGLQCFVKSNVISKKCLFEIQKGSLKVNKILASAESVSADVSETYIELGIDSKMYYAIHGEISNGAFEHPEQENIRLFRDGNTLSFSGEAGEKGTNELTTIVLFSINGDIKIIEN
jgi:hypothetical protein